MIVVAIIGLLAAIAIPNFIKARTTAQKNSCINNLRQVDGAIQQWALENKKGTGDLTNLPALSDFLKGGSVKPVVHEVYEANLIGSPAYATTNVRLGTYAPTQPISIP